MTHTAWRPEEVRKYMTARYATMRKDMDVGPFASELPAATKEGFPAELPKFVTEYCEKLKEDWAFCSSIDGGLPGSVVTLGGRCLVSTGPPLTNFDHHPKPKTHLFISTVTSLESRRP